MAADLRWEDHLILRLKMDVEIKQATTVETLESVMPKTSSFFVLVGHLVRSKQMVGHLGSQCQELNKRR